MIRKALGILASAVSAIWLLAVPAAAQLNAPQTWVGTAGGTSTALTITIHNVAALNDLLGVPIRFLPSGVSNGPSTITINLDSGGTLGPISITRPTSNLGVQPIVAELQTGVLTELTYDGTEMMISSPIDMTPIGHVVDLRQTSATAPNGYALETGQCVSQTTFASLFSLISTSYGTCGAGLFAIPNSQGTLSASLDNGINRITTTSCSAPSTVGTVCGTQTSTLSTTNLPPYTPSASSALAPIQGNTVGGTPTGTALQGNNQTVVQTIPVTITFNAQGGTSSPFPTLSPVMMARRAVKL